MPYPCARGPATADANASAMASRSAPGGSRASI